jgi:hypothetical protein
MSFQTGQKLSYQRMLRALGSYLDQERPGKFCILEVPDGFTVVVERSRLAPDLQEMHFTRGTLTEKAEQLMRGRRPSLRERAENWVLAPGGYEDFMRAIGFELDDSEAHGVLLRELESGILVTYSYLDPSQGYSWRKHMVTLGRGEIEQVLGAAYDRRQRRGILGLIR